MTTLPRYLPDPGPDVAGTARDRRAVLVLRVAVLAVCVGYTLLSEEPQQYLPAVIGLVVVAVVGSLPPVSPLMLRWQPVVESVLAATVISLTDPLAKGLLPYLLVAPLAAGLVSGATGAVLAGGLAGLVAIVSQLDSITSAPEESPFADVSLWVLLGLGLGLFGAWVRRARTGSSPSGDVAAYAAAYQLLEQLRTVSRQLSGGLDPATVATQVAERVQAGLGGSGTVVVTRSERGVLVPLARTGPAPGQVEEVLERHSGEVSWDDARPSAVAATVWVPLRVADRTVAMVVGAPDRRNASAATTAPSATVEELAESLRDDALRLETALLFDEVRSVATAEERRRLAREIHDGIAQELASLGYLVDGMLPDVTDPALAADLGQLRAEIRRVVGELRFSIYDLRSDVSGGVPLGDAISSYVREVGRRSGLTVHLVLDEAPRRLAASTEAELLRIAQEAVTNARKHAQARNLWVSCVVEPPTARLEVADDGQGLGTPREDSYGLSIMAERADRIGARLSVGDRAGGGTVVEVVLDAVGAVPLTASTGHDVRPGEEVAR